MTSLATYALARVRFSRHRDRGFRAIARAPTFKSALQPLLKAYKGIEAAQHQQALPGIQRENLWNGHGRPGAIFRAPVNYAAPAPKSPIVGNSTQGVVRAGLIGFPPGNRAIVDGHMS